ncbi:MAG: hypothetical protein ACRC5H_03315 [Treponemataceae bacterium]
MKKAIDCLLRFLRAVTLFVVRQFKFLINFHWMFLFLIIIWIVEIAFGVAGKLFATFLFACVFLIYAGFNLYVLIEKRKKDSFFISMKTESKGDIEFFSINKNAISTIKHENDKTVLSMTNGEVLTFQDKDWSVVLRIFE